MSFCAGSADNKRTASCLLTTAIRRAIVSLSATGNAPTERNLIMTRIQDNTFAAACYDQNSVEELVQALAYGPDETDCKTWGITPSDWVEQINQALEAKRLGNEY
jgi:hypothetical protein